MHLSFPDYLIICLYFVVVLTVDQIQDQNHQRFFGERNWPEPEGTKPRAIASLQ
jgi:hypothetical protein